MCDKAIMNENKVHASEQHQKVTSHHMGTECSALIPDVSVIHSLYTSQISLSIVVHSK